MKTLVKLLVLGAVLLATYRVGSVYWDHYQFEDQIKELAQFTDRNHAQELPGKILDLAQKLNIPLDADGLSVTREQRKVMVDATYVRTVELLPRVSRNWEFSVHVTVLTLN